jgi:hypothetical protein
MTTATTWGVLAAAIAISAIVAPARAQSCDDPPLFNMNGGACSTTRQGVPCGCSECLQWDPTPGATWYQVRRCDKAGANCLIVGDTRWRNRPAYTYRRGPTLPPVHPTLWCVAWDSPFPVPYALYQYSIRACTEGSSGPSCSTSFSNPVSYDAAPYMCMDNGLEVPCASLPSRPNDLDGDGITDALDPDDDGDGIPDNIDNCPRVYNPGQRDADGDGVGDACDPTPTVAADTIADEDNDGVPDAIDNCPAVYNPTQADTDHDGTGDACDNCPKDYNATQSDADGDGQGDVCDLDDGTIYDIWGSRTHLSWAPEMGYTSWCVYRGDLGELRRSGTYTQVPGSNPLAARFCAIATVGLDDSVTPAPGSTAFYLVAGRPGARSTELGVDSTGLMRANANPCP